MRRRIQALSRHTRVAVAALAVIVAGIADTVLAQPPVSCKLRTERAGHRAGEVTSANFLVRRLPCIG